MTAAVDYMRQALRLAEKGRGQVSPNPLVGAVIVRDDRVAGVGAHLRLGGPHAEIHALRDAGEDARGATLYVTLEPCCVHGRTPPCTDAIVAAGIRRVECALEDPDTRVSGRGIQQLRDAGIPVSVGLGQEEAERQNAAYLKHRRFGLPWVTLKLAQSLDGRIATASGESRWISSDASRRHVHRTRSQVDAVMVGAGTVLADDPRLTVRHVRGRDPRPVIIDGKGRVPLTARVLLRSGAVLVTSDEYPPSARAALEQRDVEVWTLPAANGRIDLRDTMHRAAAGGITSMLLEGGGNLAAQALAAQIVDGVQIYLAPLLLGRGIDSVGELNVRHIDQAVHLVGVHVRRLGPDFLYTGRVQYSCSPE